MPPPRQAVLPFAVSSLFPSADFREFVSGHGLGRAATTLGGAGLSCVACGRMTGQDPSDSYQGTALAVPLGW